MRAGTLLGVKPEFVRLGKIKSCPIVITSIATDKNFDAGF